MNLTLAHLLATIRDRHIVAREALLDEGYHPNVVSSKFEKAHRRGYTDFGVHPERAWLTEKGRRFLELAA
jgi:hypothetical protein